MNGQVITDFHKTLGELEKSIDLSRFFSDKSFNEMFHIDEHGDMCKLENRKDVDFYQFKYKLCFTEQYGKYTDLLIVEEENKEALETYIKEVHERLKEVYEKYIEECVNTFDRDTFRYYCRIGTDVGIIKRNGLLLRNGYQEMLEEIEEEKYNDRYEPSCSRCGDGGCLSCEPYRFI